MHILLTHVPSARERYFGAGPLARLRGLGEVRLHDGAEPLDTDGLIAAATGCDVVITDRQTPVEARAFDGLPELVMLVRVAMDIRNIDVPAASRAGVLIANATAGFVDAVAELGIAMMVDLARGISRSVGAYRAGAAQDIRMGTQLAGANVGIIGYGAIGRRLAEIAHALRMNVLVADPHQKTFAPHVEVVELKTLLARARFVVCLAVANEQTENLMNADAFAAMAPGSFFVNLSRGNLVDEAALAAALERGHLAGAAMDVGRAPDQMPSLALVRRADVIATPHIGGLTPEAVAHQANEAVDHVAALQGRRLPKNAVNASHATRLKRVGLRMD